MLESIQQVCDLHSGVLSKATPPNRYVHRDIKLDNFLIRRPISSLLSRKLPLKVTLIDFGFAKKLDSTNQVADALCGTLGYLAPEIHQNLEINTRLYSFATDIYALGVTMSLQLVQFALALKIFAPAENKRLQKWLYDGDYAEPIRRRAETISSYLARKNQYTNDLRFLSTIHTKVEEHIKSISYQEAKVWSDLVKFSQKMRAPSPSERPLLPQVKMFCANLSKKILLLPQCADEIDSDDEIESVTSEYGDMDNEDFLLVNDLQNADTDTQTDINIRSLAASACVRESGVTSEQINLPDNQFVESLAEQPRRKNQVQLPINKRESPAEKLKRSIRDAIDSYQEYHPSPCCCSFFNRHSSAGMKRTSNLRNAIDNLTQENLTIDSIKGTLSDFFKQGSCFSLGKAKAANNNHSFIRFFIEKLHENLADVPNQPVAKSIENAMAALDIQNFTIPKTTQAVRETELDSPSSLEPIYTATFKAISESCMKEFAAFPTMKGA
jgi:serine/threonine protein kinase